MTYQVLVEPRAMRDLWAAAQWIEAQAKSPAKALQWVRSVRAKTETLKANPLRCSIDPDSNAYGEEVRMLLYGKRHGKYRILFAVRGDVVPILTVCHTAQQNLSEGSGEANDDDEATPLH